MKRKVAIIAAGMIIAISGVAWGAGTNGEFKGFPVVNVVVNGKTVQGEAPGINLDGTTLVPLRAIGESLGAKIGWDPATSTATLTIASNAGGGSSTGNTVAQKPEDPETSAMNQSMIKFSEKIKAYYDNLPVVREKIRIAKEFYDIRNENFYFQQLDVGLMKKMDTAFTDLISAGATSDMSKAREKGYPIVSFIQTVEKINSSMKAYKLSADQYVMYKQNGKKEFLDFYITNYSTAFEEELKAKEMLDAAIAELNEKMKKGAPGK